jgi:glycosyltransferase involved in cell wall biosynthesis
MLPKVSVIIPTYNAASFIRQAIESVLGQTYPDWELIVIDDGSTDKTFEMVSPFRDRLRYVTQRNQGRPQARNAGLRKAKGEYIAFLDADDVWKPGRLERGVGFLEQRPEIGLIHGEVEVINVEGKLMPKETEQTKKFYRIERKKGSGYLRLLDRSAIFSSTILLRRECINRVGFYDTSFPIYEDYDWYLRFSLNFKIGLLDGPPVACYRIHDENVTRRYDSKTIAEIYIGILEKQLARQGEKLKGFELRKAQSHLLAKLAEFHLVRHDKKQARSKLLDAFRLDPTVALEWDSLKRLIFSLW